MLHDYHMHSNFSCDCKFSMEEMCRSAIQKRIPEIGFSDHYDLHPGESCPDWFRPEAWFAELERCRAKFGGAEFAGQIIIRAGIEIGEPHIYRAEAQAMSRRLPFDYILGSLHWVGSETIFDPNYFRRPQDEAYRLFFKELDSMTKVGGFDILSHFDVPVRTGFEVYGGYDPRLYEDAIRPVLRNCIEHGIALDINTKGLRSKCNVLTPGVDILRWYAEMGGERVTLGSDAHQPMYIGENFKEAIEAVRAAGIKYLTQFEGRQAKMMPLP